jgi:GntR family transcriptional regulator
MPAPPSSDEAVVPPFWPDRSSPVPLYFQVATHLEHAIMDGTIPPGTLFENEIALADDMGLSRPTMRRAMQYLVDKGLIVRRRGIGTRVVHTKVRRPLELTSLYDDLAAAGQEPSTTVLGFEQLEADIELAGVLNLSAGAPIVRIERLRSALDTPIARMTNYLPADLVKFDRVELESTGLYELLRRSGVRLHSATQTIGARIARGSEARQLGESRGAALLTMTRTSYDDRSQVVEYATHLYAASRHSFDVHLLTP